MPIRCRSLPSIVVSYQQFAGTRFIHLRWSIVNRGDWLWCSANIKGAKKDAMIYVGRSTTVHNLLFCAHTLCMNYITKAFLLVSSSVWSKQLLCFVHCQGQKSKQKQTTKNFVGFHNHSPLLFMIVMPAQVFCDNVTSSNKSDVFKFKILFSYKRVVVPVSTP